MTAPDFMPVLSAGRHFSPAEGACVMEYVSVIAGEEFTDTPACTDFVLACAAWNVNDNLNDDERHLLIPFITRLIGTSGYEYDPAALTDALVALAPDLRVTYYEPPSATTSSLPAMVERLRGKGHEQGRDEPTIASEVVYRLVHAGTANGPDKVAMLGKILDAFDKVTGHTDAGDLTEQINEAAALVVSARG